MNIKETLQRGGIRITEFAKIVGVNRVTVSTWVNGHFLPHTFIRPKVEKLLGAVNAAVKAKTLPLPDDPTQTRTERLKEIKYVLQAALKAQQQ